jgi:hypothetical protein
MSTVTRSGVVGVVATVVRWVGLVFAVVLVVHVLLTVGDANPDNGITKFFRATADPLALAFKSLFTPENAHLRVLVNYGLAALFWLVVSAVLSRLIRRLA